MSKEAMTLALEALKNYDGQTWEETQDAIKALEEALAKQEQKEDFFKQIGNQSMMQLWQNYCDVKVERDELQEKLSKQEQGEPVAWQERQARRMQDGVVTEWTNWYPCRYKTIDEARAEACDHIRYEWRPLYTTPQPAQKPWVGLTDEQYFEIGQRHWLSSNKVAQIHRELDEADHGIKENT